jgi:hypothetical protein
VIVCRILRNATVDTFSQRDVTVFVLDFGYAATMSSVPDLPSVVRAFVVTGVSPSAGGLYGGNAITIEGLGFPVLEDFSRYTVSMLIQGLKLTVYETLLLTLGLPNAPQTSDSCAVTSVSSTSITCTLPGNMTHTNDTIYTPSIAVNSVSSACIDSSSKNYSNSVCSYRQLASMTPSVDSITVLSTDSFGAVTFAFNGSLLFSGAYRVFIDDVYKCTVLEDTTSAILSSSITGLIRSPPLPGGWHTVSALVDAFGYAASNVSFQSAIEIHNVTVESALGSMAGGTLMTISGFGFNAKCLRNNVTIGLSTGISVPVVKILACSTSNISVLTPSIINITSTSTSTVSAVSVTVTTSDALSVTYPSPAISSSSSSSASVFTYSSARTPVVSISNTSGYAMDSVVFDVSYFAGTDAYDSRNGVTFGTDEVPCVTLEVLALTSTKITWKCTVPYIAAGLVAVDVAVHPFGSAILKTRVTPTFRSLFYLDQPSHKVFNSSVIGGSVLTVTGKGFSNEATVTVCGVECATVTSSVTYSSLSCQTPARMTASAVEHFNTSGITKDLIDMVEGTVFASSASYKAYAFDSDYTTYYSHYSASCYIGLAMASGYRVRPYRMRYYPRLQYSQLLGTVLFEGSTDGGVTYKTLASTSASAREGWNYLTVNASSPYAKTWFSHLRYRPGDGYDKSHCWLAELKFLGTVAAKKEVCTVNVTQPHASSSVTLVSSSSTRTFGSVSYAGLTSTPIVRYVSPNNGTALGGTTVTIYGEHFISNTTTSLSMNTAMLPTVSFSGVSCSVVSHSSTEITCITGLRTPDMIESMKITVDIPGLGFALVSDDAKFLYIDRWSALTTWRHQEPPVEGDFVVIPDGQVVLMDVKTPILSVLLIQGALHFDSAQEVSLDAHYVYIQVSKAAFISWFIYDFCF